MFEDVGGQTEFVASLFEKSAAVAGVVEVEGIDVEGLVAADEEVELELVVAEVLV